MPTQAARYIVTPQSWKVTQDLLDWGQAERIHTYTCTVHVHMYIPMQCSTCISVYLIYINFSSIEFINSLLTTGMMQWSHTHRLPKSCPSVICCKIKFCANFISFIMYISYYTYILNVNYHLPSLPSLWTWTRLDVCLFPKDDSFQTICIVRKACPIVTSRV